MGFERQWAQIGHVVGGSNPCGRGQHQAANGLSTILFSSSKSKSRLHSTFTHRTVCLPITKAGLSGTAIRWISCSFPQCGHVICLRLTVVASIYGFYHAPGAQSFTVRSSVRRTALRSIALFHERV